MRMKRGHPKFVDKRRKKKKIVFFKRGEIKKWSGFPFSQEKKHWVIMRLSIIFTILFWRGFFAARSIQIKIIAFVRTFSFIFYIILKEKDN